MLAVPITICTRSIARGGTLKWKFETGSRVTSSPAVAAGAVYFESYDGIFYAVDGATGKLKWKFQTGGERRFAGKHLHGTQPVGETMPDPFDFYLSSAVVAEGAAYFGSGDGNIYALDAATGQEKWRFKTGEDQEIHNQVGLQASPAVADGVVYFGCRDSNFYAVDANSGRKKWAFNNKGSWVIGSAAVKDGKVYFATSDSGLFYALDAPSGAQVFSWTSKRWPMFSSPAVAGGMLYIGSHEGKLFAIDLARQKPAWSFQTDGAQQNGPTYTKPDGTPKYEAAFSDDFYEDMVIGVQKMMSVGAILSSPVVGDDVVYFGSSDGNLYAVN